MCHSRWLSLPEDVRQFVKENVIQILGTEPFRPSVAAQCVAAVACAEIPQGVCFSFFFFFFFFFLENHWF